jgi:hypothetical protein
MGVTGFVICFAVLVALGAFAAVMAWRAFRR